MGGNQRAIALMGSRKGAGRLLPGMQAEGSVEAGNRDVELSRARSRAKAAHKKHTCQHTSAAPGTPPIKQTMALHEGSLAGGATAFQCLLMHVHHGGHM